MVTTIELPITISHFFFFFYENADELIHEIEEFYTLSRKEKELLRKIDYTKGIEEVVDNG